VVFTRKQAARSEFGLDLQKVKDELKAQKITAVNPETIPVIMQIM
jgi:hypothetical protein